MTYRFRLNFYILIIYRMSIYSTERPNLIESETGKKITDKIIRYTQTIKSQTTDLWTTIYTVYIKPHKQLLFLVVLITVFLYYRYQMDDDDDDDDLDKEEIIKYKLKKRNKKKMFQLKNYTLDNQTTDINHNYPIIDNYVSAPVLINKQTHDMGRLASSLDFQPNKNNNDQELNYDFLDQAWEETVIPPYLE
jgi:hypothetical protein